MKYEQALRISVLKTPGSIKHIASILFNILKGISGYNSEQYSFKLCQGVSGGSGKEDILLGWARGRNSSFTHYCDETFKVNAE